MPERCPFTSHFFLTSPFSSAIRCRSAIMSSKDFCWIHNPAEVEEFNFSPCFLQARHSFSLYHLLLIAKLTFRYKALSSVVYARKREVKKGKTSISKSSLATTSFRTYVVNSKTSHRTCEQINSLPKGNRTCTFFCVWLMTLSKHARQLVDRSGC